MGLGQYNSLGEYCGPHTASSVFLILLRVCTSLPISIFQTHFLLDVHLSIVRIDVGMCWYHNHLLNTVYKRYLPLCGNEEKPPSSFVLGFLFYKRYATWTCLEEPMIKKL